jgi:zinc D-Ala-D-Ala carboxypeptidase
VTSGEQARTTIRRTPIRRGRVAGLLVVLAVAGVLCDQLLAWSSSTIPSSARVPDGEPRRAPGEHRAPPRERLGALGQADGAVPDGTAAFDDGVPGVAKLDPALLGALRRAATDAADDGVELLVDSGWRSARYQQHLLDEAVAKYGSAAAAARWVATPDRSAHVSGDAVDIGPSAATAWLSRNGAEYGLCQIYRNEPWHYELRAEATDLGCPSMYADAAHDPRMQR